MSRVLKQGGVWRHAVSTLHVQWCFNPRAVSLVDSHIRSDSRTGRLKPRFKRLLPQVSADATFCYLLPSGLKFPQSATYTLYLQPHPTSHCAPAIVIALIAPCGLRQSERRIHGRVRRSTPERSVFAETEQGPRCVEQRRQQWSCRAEAGPGSRRSSWRREDRRGSGARWLRSRSAPTG